MHEAKVEVKIFDTTLRDGAQSLPEINQFPNGTKMAIAHNIAKMEAGVIEAGFPRTAGDEEEVREVAESIGRLKYRVQNWRDGENIGSSKEYPIIAGLCRTMEEDIIPAWRAVEPAKYPRIHTFVSTDPEHMSAKFPGKTPKQVLKMGERAVRFAREISSDNKNATIEASAEAATTTNPKYLERVVKTFIDAGADVINLPDTVGQRDPFWMSKFYSQVIKWIMQVNPEVVISAHNHNDIDMATANSLALVRSAAKYVAKNNQSVKIQLETTICGTGERAGNADVFPVVAGLFKFSPDFKAPVEWQFNPSSMVQTANTVLGYGDMAVDRQSTIVGIDTITHRSGIHSAGIVDGGYQIYTPHDPRFWGHTTDAIHQEGKYQGRKGREASMANS